MNALRSGYALPIFAALFVLVVIFFISDFARQAFVVKSDVMVFDNLVNLVAPAFIAAVFIERAAEIFVMALRRGRRIEKEAVLANLHKQLSTEVDPATQKNLQTTINLLVDSITAYKRETLQWAFGFTIFFSLLISIVGVRLLHPFFEVPFEECLNGVIDLSSEPEECPSGILNLQDFYSWFIKVDIFITTFVIAGGAAGFHNLLNTITNFANNKSAPTSH